MPPCDDVFAEGSIPIFVFGVLSQGKQFVIIPDADALKLDMETVTNCF